MVDLLASGSSWLNSQFKASGSRQVSYTNKQSQVVLLDATIGESNHSEVDKNGVVIREKTHDFIIDAAQLDFGSGPVDPQRGEIITDTIGGKVHSFKVLPAGNDPCFRWCDSQRTRIRIHTKLSGIE